jgi:hypothetical protein
MRLIGTVVFMVGNTKEEALRAYVGEFNEPTLALLDYSKLVWTIENAENGHLLGFFNGKTEDDARAAYAKYTGGRVATLDVSLVKLFEKEAA